MIKRIVVIVVLIYTTAECKNYRYDYTYNCDANGWIKYHQIPATWQDAWLRCRLEGAVLASPSNVFMNLAMRTVMKSNQMSKKGVFSGVHARFSKGDYLSAEGLTLRDFRLSAFNEINSIGILPVDWMPTEPNNQHNNEDCLIFTPNGTIGDVSCNDVHPYMCYKKKTSNMILNGCGTYDHAYRMDLRSGSCYKFHLVPRNWTRAHMTCVAEGGHLVIINSESEAVVLKELFERNPPHSIIAAIPGEMRNVMHVGFHDWGEPGVFTTIDGRRLKDAGFNLWSKYQPDNAAPGEHCGGMFRNGTLCDLGCHQRAPFVCEKSPASLLNEEDL